MATSISKLPQIIALGIAAGALSGCLDGTGLDRFGGTPSSGAAETYIPPEPDSQGLITYQSYQVAVAGEGDTIRRMADRFGQSVDEMASLNGIRPDVGLRAGEVVVLPAGVDGSAIVDGRIVEGGSPIRRPGEVDIQTLASDAIDAADPSSATPEAPSRPLDEPSRHRVQSGETASSIANLYGISVRALADWNGLGSDNRVRIGQSLLIPPPGATVAPILTPAEKPKVQTSAPGGASAVSEPPSASQPLPKDEPEEVEEPKEEPAAKPAGGSGVLTLPVNGSIIRDFKKGSSDGIDIAAAAGSPVVAAGSGTVAAITQDATGNSIVVIRHADGLLTVYAGIDQISVTRGQSVSRGQKIAVVRAGSPSALHFETRKGFESVDPGEYLN